MMHNQKKYTLTIWGFLTALVSACSQYDDPYKDVPKEVDGHPVYEVPFEQPLVIDPKKEQVFYFKLNKKFEIGNAFNIRTVVLRPDSNIVTKHIADGVEQYKTQEIPKYAKYRNLIVNWLKKDYCSLKCLYNIMMKKEKKPRLV
jgi:lipoprotein